MRRKKSEIASFSNKKIKEIIAELEAETSNQKSILAEYRKHKHMDPESHEQLARSYSDNLNEIFTCRMEIEFRETHDNKSSEDVVVPEDSFRPPQGAIDYIVEKMCNNKKVYQSSYHAGRVAEKVRKETGETIKAYKCPICKEFHLGHPAKK